MSSLMKLQMYTESDSDGEEEKCSDVSRLPLPGFIEKTLDRNISSREVNKEGKIRNFPHEPGNWATYLFIPVDSSEFSSYLDDLLNLFKPLDLKLVEDFHISLTRTFILRHHWIPDFISGVRNNLKEISPFQIHLVGLKAYTNEQNTRSFLSLKVNKGEEYLQSVGCKLSSCLREYNLHGLYEDPSFHVSLLWCPGDKFSEISKIIDALPLTLKNFEYYQKVSYCICATGNKRFTFNFC